jgi:hypothetical protein
MAHRTRESTLTMPAEREIALARDGVAESYDKLTELLG